MNPELSVAKPKQIEMDEEELVDAVRAIGNWVGTQIEQMKMPIQKFPSFVRVIEIDDPNGAADGSCDCKGCEKAANKIKVLRVRWVDPAIGGHFERIFTPPAGCNVDAALRIMKHILNAARGGK
ncbi:hypothetical protein UFOVP141_15 [uncultured Caudovirales phage]|uniref:Uncharacterized protein n=1 Tax=uncultured Caudovirales phage TaxID=2100421 RepID=A0A6J7VKI3_9CAUD|nr:hypothetical protein UFOVP141_15 [uncultured Caudovirales phage]